MGAALQDMSDAALVVAVGRWRNEALAEIYRRHGGAVYALARRVLNDVTDAEEVVQEVFLRLWNAPEKFDPERGSLRSYLLAQAHGRAVDLLRADSSRRRREEREARETAEKGYDLEHQVWDLAVADRVKAAVSTLPVDEHREVAAALAFAGETAPEGLWDRINARLEEAPPDLDMAPIVPMRRPSSAAGDRRSTGLRAAALVAAAAAAVVIGVLGVQVA